MNTRDEIKAIWGKISDMNWRLTKARGSIVPATDPTQFAFMDHFSDASIHWGYRLLGISAAKTILEPVGTTLDFHVNAGTNADWSGTLDNAPHVAIGMPGWPCEIIAKISAFNEAANTNPGIFVGRTPGVAANYAVLFGPYDMHQIRAYNLGAAAMNLMIHAGFPLWIKIRMTSNWNYGYMLTCWFSNDNIIWTQYEHPAGTPWEYNSGYLSYSGCAGMYIKNWSAFNLATASFDYFQMVRSFGPGGA